jgi:abortive infection bacteriophage resistance protein
LAVKPELPNTWKAQSIDNRRFYIIALIIQTLLDEVSPNSRWKERLKAHLDAYPGVDLRQLHFPTSWHQSAPWA